MPTEIDLTAIANLPPGGLRAFPTPDGSPQVLLTRQQTSWLFVTGMTSIRSMIPLPRFPKNAEL